MYKVVKHFTDLQDDNHAYNTGDTFPRKGFKVDEKRIQELLGNDNKQGTSLIKRAKNTKSDSKGKGQVEEKTSAE
jgi:hypothetical protein